jgi:hypothetical protein
MPKTRAPATVAPSVGEQFPAALTAAGKMLPRSPDYWKISKSGRGWQDRAWEFYDLIGEYRYAVDWVGNMISKATLYLTRSGERVTDGQGVDYVYSLFGGPEAQSQILREIGVHLTVAGELYVVGVTKKDVEEWRCVAATELTTRGGNYYASSKIITSDSEVLVIRVWRPHPRRWRDATSPSRAVLPTLAELDVLTKRIFAEIDSRLAGAGVFFVPSQMDLPTSPATAVDGTSTPGQSLASTFQRDLQDAMMTAISDQEDASAMVPIVVAAPGEHIGNAKHITFWSELNEKAPALRNEAIRRLALGLDMPPDVLTGAADVNHWNMWAVEEGAIKAHAEPLLALICESFTEGYLRPLLIADGMSPDDAAEYSIAADTSMLRLRPNRSAEAFELYDRMQIDGASLRRESGFSEDDAPSMDELRELLLRRVASGSTTPELVASALQSLGVLPAGGLSDPQAVPVEARPAPSLTDHPHQGPPEQPVTAPRSDDDEGLLGAADVMVYRALERAGNRLRAKLGRRTPGAASEAHLHAPVSSGICDELLADAFTGIERYVACKATDTHRLADRLEAYTRLLLVQGRAHDARALSLFLARPPVAELPRCG